MEIATIFLALLGFEYLWWVLARRRNLRIRRERIAAALQSWVGSQRNEWTEEDD